jgi:hypothetical protein
MNKFHVLFLCFTLSLSVSTYAGNDLNINSFCSGFYSGINESQPFSGIGKEAKESYKHFQMEVNKLGSMNSQEFNDGKKEGLKTRASKANYKKISKNADECFNLNSKFVQSMSDEELMQSYK